MSDAARAVYLARAYPDHLHAFAHPRRILGAARLYGHPSPAPETARVLDIGCNRGGQLRWVARTLPESRCLGIDFLPAAIEEARAAANPPNLAFEVADVAAFDPGAERYDLVVAHGIYSWVAEETREALLDVMRRALAPGGIAMVSWNALPGAALRMAIGQMMQLEEARGAGLRSVLDRLETGLPGIRGAAHAPRLARTVRLMKGVDPDIQRSDEAGPETEAFHLLEVAERAAAHGLAYLADVEPAEDWLAGAPKPVREALDGLPRLTALQLRDFLLDTAFRRGMFVRAEDAGRLSADADARVALDLHAWPEVQAAPPAEDGARRFVRPEIPDTPLEGLSADGEAILACLLEGPTAPLGARLAAAGHDPEGESLRWGTAALVLASRRLLSLHLGPPPAPPRRRR